MTSTLTARPADPPWPSSRHHDAGGSWNARPCWSPLVGTGFLYLWNLSADGWANAFYSAAAQAGGASWEAWFFGPAPTSPR
ncbi:hypothetical protein GCM10023215_30590 [Pseudonocardia yuanmonensis]|uniref:Uncharacterized protein n=1 Tax=Pseudonocardia yuanmonensis TaxID=1095914 RepID=A0ABP8WLS1_9PSEU